MTDGLSAGCFAAACCWASASLEIRLPKTCDGPLALAGMADLPGFATMDR
jgi:hypothetical protein